MPVGDLALSRVLLAKDANYPWLILVPRRAGVSELIDLRRKRAGAVARRDRRRARRRCKATVPCDKLNIAALGNMVAQLHVHVIARTKNDAAWPKPVWGAAEPRAYDTRTALRERLLDDKLSAARLRVNGRLSVGQPGLRRAHAL